MSAQPQYEIATVERIVYRVEDDHSERLYAAVGAVEDAVLPPASLRQRIIRASRPSPRLAAL